MGNVDRNRKLLVRTALITSSTIATLIGAQNLALLDTRQIEQVLAPTTEPTAMPPVTPGLINQPEATAHVLPTIEIAHAAPSITILRQPGQAGPIQPVSAGRTAIQPPKPVQLAAPPPIVVQGEAPPPIVVQQASGASAAPASRTQSSR